MTLIENFIGVTKTHEVVAQAMKLPERFVGFDDLQPTSVKILQVLEARSFYSAGDTKISDTRLAKVIGVCVKTIVRHLRKLEDRQFIVRATERHSGVSDKCSSRNDFYSIRTIRCLRVTVYSGGEVKTTAELGWKTDSRPKEWMNPICPEKYRKKKSTGLYVNPITFELEPTPVYEDPLLFLEMYKDDILDVNLHDNLRKYEHMRDLGDEVGLGVLGYRRKTEEK